MLNLDAFDEKTLANFIPMLVLMQRYGVSPEAAIAQIKHHNSQARLQYKQPPCPGCIVAQWVTFDCGAQGWACSSSLPGQLKDGTIIGVCNAI